MSDKVLAYFKGDKKFSFLIEKAVAADGEEWIISGVASSTNVDFDEEKMSIPALKKMANIINFQGVPLRVEHSKDDNHIIGEVFEASIDDRNRLIIKARLNKENKLAEFIWKAIKEGKKFGFSVGGKVKKAVKVLSESLGKYVKSFYDIILEEVSITPAPANYDSWLFAKSLPVGDSEIRNKFYKEFLSENKNLDYLYCIEKSLDTEKWVKVKNNILNYNKNKGRTINKENNMSLKEVIRKAIKKALTSIKKDDKPILDVNTEELVDENPVEDKVEETTTSTEEVVMDEKDKEELKEEIVQAVEEVVEEVFEQKAEETGDETTGEETTEVEETEKVLFNSSAPKVENKKPVKPEDDEENKEKSREELMKVIEYIAKSYDEIKETLKKQNRRLIGLEQKFQDAILKNQDLQKSIKKLANEAGFKKSVSVPYVRTKDGSVFRLVSVDDSEKEIRERNFAEFYKSNVAGK